MGAGVRDAFPPPDVCVDCVRVSFGQIACKNITGIGRGGACVPARVTQLSPKCSVGPSF